MMDQEALMIVEEYVMRHLDPSDTEPEFEVYIVWKAKVLQNWKYLISTSLPDGMYYEMTYHGDRQEWIWPSSTQPPRSPMPTSLPTS